MERQLSILAKDILETIEKEDAFDNMKKQGGFKVLKAKDIKGGIL